MNKKIYILMIVLVLLLSGCKGNKSEVVDTEKPDETKEVSDVVVYDIDLMEMFPKSIDFSWIYTGTYDSSTIEMIVNIEEDYANNFTVLSIEGADGDLSGGESGETAYFRTIKLSEDNIIESNSDFDTVILQSPISMGRTWETKWYSRNYGEFIAEAKIVEASEDRVSVEYKPIHPEIDLVPTDYRIRYEFKVGSGIIASEENIIDVNNNSNINIRYDLFKTSQTKVDGFLQKYSSGNEIISRLYKNSEYSYNKVYTDSYKWLMAIENKTEASVVNKFSSVLSELDRLDSRNVELGLKLLYLYSGDFENKDRFLDIYKQFYYDVLYSTDWDLFDSFQIDYDDYDKIFSFNEEYFYFEYNTEEKSEYLETIVSYLRNNGIGLNYMEGFPYPSPYPTYLYNKISYLGSEEYQDYLNLDMIDQYNSPYVDDGGLITSISSIFEYSAMIEDFVNKYPESEYINKDDNPSKGLISLLMLPNYLDNTPSFESGRFNMYTYKEINNLIEKYKDYDFMKDIEELLNTLRKSDFYITTEYLKKTKALGFPNDFFELPVQAVEYQKQSDELKSIQKNLRINELYKTVYVENIEELMENISPFTNIILKQGDYTLNYSSTDYPYAQIVDGTLVIKDVNNIHITTETTNPITILSPNYNYAIELQNVENVVIDKLRVGHIFEYCVSGSVHIADSKNVSINNSIVFGCGEWGIEFDSSSNIYIQNSVISDCNTYGIKGLDSSVIVVKDSIIARNSKYFMSLINIDNINFYNVKFYDNKEETYISGDYGVYLENVENMFFSDSEFSNNSSLKNFDPELYIYE